MRRVMDKFKSNIKTQKFTVTSPEQMQELGSEIADTVCGGNVILLSGELGAGKTVISKGIAKGLGVTAPVVSPTFTIMNEYFGRIKFCHFDAYRLADADEACGAGLADFIGNPECVCAVEWWENIQPLFYGLKTIHIKITKVDDDTREVVVEQ